MDENDTSRFRSALFSMDGRVHITYKHRKCEKCKGSEMGRRDKEE